MKLEVSRGDSRIARTEVIFVTGIRATLQKYFTLKGEVLDLSRK